MHDDQPVPSPPTPSLLTRRHVLVAGAAVGSAVALRGLPALGQEAEGSTSSSSSTTSTTSSTTTTTTRPATTTSTTAPAPPPSVAAPAPTTTTEPVHPTERITGQTRGYDTNLSISPDKKIMFPLLGRPNDSSTWTDSYGACRSGCSRRHQGQDLLAPQMTKILSVCDGTIVEFRDRSDGNAVWIQGDDGWFYAYLHVNDEKPGTHTISTDPAHAWAPALRQYVGNETAARGHRVRRGEFIAYVGDSGNAEGTYHLHFEIRQPATGSFSSETQRMWSSAAVNPKVSLQNAAAAKESVPVPPEAFRPWDSSTAFITAQYVDFLGRTPSSGDVAYYRDLLDYGTRSPEWLMQFFLESSEGDSKTQSIARLYQAFYKRLPDTDGFLYWMDARRTGGWSIYRVAEQFAKAPEFKTMYGTLDDAAYVDRVYDNVLGRAPDAAGKQYWIDQLASGVTRGRVMTSFSESPEYKASQQSRMHVVGCYGVMLNRIPTNQELAAWKGHLDGGGSTRDMIAMLRTGDEYLAAAKA